jgi:hypothetical protein
MPYVNPLVEIEVEIKVEVQKNKYYRFGRLVLLYRIKSQLCDNCYTTKPGMEPVITSGMNIGCTSNFIKTYYFIFALSSDIS